MIHFSICCQAETSHNNGKNISDNYEVWLPGSQPQEYKYGIMILGNKFICIIILYIIYII